jgi:hypothetical protein
MDVNPIDLIIGSAIMPPVIALLNQRRWSSPVKGVVALVACLVAALVVEFVRGPIESGDWRDTALVVAGSAFVSFRTFWAPSGIAPALEKATSAAPDEPPPPQGDPVSGP